MSSQYLIVLLLLVTLIALLALPSVRSFIAKQLAHFRRPVAPPPPQPRASAGMTTLIDGNGRELDLPTNPNQARSLSARLEQLGGQRRLLAVAIVGLIAVIAVVQLYRYTNAPPAGSFVVLVAPFSEQGGVGPTGREVAAGLVAALPETSGGRVVARSISEPPANTDQALELLGREGADALVWGEIDSGGMLNRESLQPMLVYRPRRPLAPLAWENYAGRFAIPTAYQLSNRQINGAVVLPALLGALADYDAGRFDSAFTTLGTLLANYPALATALPSTLRGNMLWAHGQYAEAANEYDRALSSVGQTAGTQAALLYNNKGAILQDAGDSNAAAAFNQAIAALDGRDLSELRYNLGIQMLGANNLAEAVTTLEIARSPNLTPAPPTALLLALGRAYRQNGQFDQARAALDAAERQIAADLNGTTVELHNVTSTRLNAALETERALLEIAQANGARGSLIWEMLGNEPISMSTLESARSKVDRAVDNSSVVSQLWTRIATSKDAANEPISAQIAINQAQRAQDLMRERQRWQALINIERGTVQGNTKPRGLAAIWAAIAGDRTPVGVGRSILEDLLQSRPGDVDTLVLLGHSELIGDDRTAAQAQFDRAAALAPERPEPVYGQALVALPGDGERGRQLLLKAIALNPAFFPARERLITLAEAAKDWPTAIEQRRWFAANRPSTENTLALAAALRQSGPAGYAEAEQVLLPLANRNNARAMIALAQLYQAHGDAEGARGVMERALALAPRDSSVAYAYGQILEQQGSLAAAKDQYNRAIEINASDVPSRLALGRIYAAEGDPVAAGQQYQVALAAGEDNPAELDRIGGVLLENGEYQAANTAYDRAIATLKAPNPPASDSSEDPKIFESRLYHGLGQAKLKLGQLGEAQAAEQQALDLRDGAYPEALAGMGDIALQQGRPADAVDRYRDALKLDGKMVGAAIGLGRASAALGNWSVAQAQFGDAIKLDPQSAEAHLWLGEALVRTSNPGAAIGEYARAIELRPNYAEAFFGLAQAQIANGQTNLARDNLASALQIRPAYPEALLLQGKLFEQTSDDNAALAAYSQAIKTGPALAEPPYRRALLYMRYDKLDEATSDLQTAIKIQPNFSEAHYWLGRAFLAQNKPQQARAELVTAIEQRGGTFADARFYQGLAEERLGDRNQAVASYQSALEQDQNGQWASEARTALVRLRQP